MGICVFWYPSIYHLKINKRLRRFVTERSISDFGTPAILRVSIDRGTNTSIIEAQEDDDLIKRPITIKLFRKEKDGTEADVFSEFKLIYKNHSRNGMVVYEFEKPSNYPTQNARDFVDFLENICYHYVKTLFHDHEVQGDRDSGLKAYVHKSEEPFDITSIKKNKNSVLEFYISQYENLLSDYAEKISVHLRHYDNVIFKFVNRMKMEVYLGIRHW